MTKPLPFWVWAATAAVAANALLTFLVVRLYFELERVDFVDAASFMRVYDFYFWIYLAVFGVPAFCLAFLGCALVSWVPRARRNSRSQHPGGRPGPG